MALKIVSASEDLRRKFLKQEELLRRTTNSVCALSRRPQFLSLVLDISRRPSQKNVASKVNQVLGVRIQNTFLASVLISLSVLSMPIHGQTETVLVSNWSQSVNATSLVDDERLQTFTTGSDTNGYVLTRVELDFVLPTAIDSFTVHLWTIRDNRPRDRIAILETTEVVIGAPTEFKPTNSVRLQPNTEYLLHIAMTNPDEVLIFKATKFGSEDRSIPGDTWRIADSSVHIPNVGSSTWVTEESVLKLRIFGFTRTTDD